MGKKVFFSYCRDDAGIVTFLAERSERAGIDVFIDKWDLKAGRPWLEALYDAIRLRKTFVFFVGPRLGNFQREERTIALKLTGSDRERRFIPVLLPGCNGKSIGFEGNYTWVDVRDLEPEEAARRLIRAVRGERLCPQIKTPPEGREAGRMRNAFKALSLKILFEASSVKWEKRDSGLFVRGDDGLFRSFDDQIEGRLYVRDAKTGKMRRHFVIDDSEVLHHLHDGEENPITGQYPPERIPGLPGGSTELISDYGRIVRPDDYLSDEELEDLEFED